MGLFSEAKWRLLGWFVLCAVIGFGLAIIVPNFVKARSRPSRNACIPNLKQMDGAVQQWALENMKKPQDPYALTDASLLAYMKGSVLPRCPQGGRYSAGTNITDSPKCSHPGHTL